MSPGEKPDPPEWAAVDAYLDVRLALHDEALDAAVAASEDAGLPAIQVTPSQGRLLHLLARMRDARAILEIGTLGGYSTIWLARALRRGGMLVTLELEPKHAEVARRNLERAGLADRVEVRVGPALASLEQLAADGAGPFDLTFIDADKPNNPRYFEWAVKLSRPGAAILVDNVIRHGAVADAASEDPSVIGSRAVLEAMAQDPRVTATAIQTVGAKGHDGFALAIVNG